MKTLTLFVYGGPCQNNGLSCERKVKERIAKAAQYVSDNPDTACTVIFAAGRKPSITSDEPARMLMKRYLTKKLDTARAKGSVFPNPEIVLLSNEHCSIESETVALLCYALHHKITELWIVYSLADIFTVSYHVNRLFSKFMIHLEAAWLPPWMLSKKHSVTTEENVLALETN